MMDRTQAYLPCLAIALTGLAGCMLSDGRESAPAEANAVVEAEESLMAMDDGPKGGAAPSRAKKEAKRRRPSMKVADRLLGGKLAAAPEPQADEDDSAGGEAAPTRAWFPETFLFEPAVLTDEAGHAELEVKVPDRLTTWRVLALAHSRAGGLAGATHAFRSTLPVYVDPVLPPALFVGDEVEVPIQVVNTTDAAVRAPVEVEVDADLAAKLSGGGPVTVPAGRSVVQPARLRAERPGTLRFRAGLIGKDAVERPVDIRSVGRPVIFEKGGTLGGARQVQFDLPEDVEPGATRLVLSVYPGALGVLRSELVTATTRRGLAEDAYALSLAGRGAKLLSALGAQVAEPEALRKMGLVAAQRVVRAARAPSVEHAALFTEAAVVHEGNPVLERLGARLATQLARAQRPDGTFAGGAGWPLRRVMVASAEAVSALRAAASDDAGRRRADAAALRASGAFERYAPRIDDPYTAAWAVASGVAQGSLRERFVKVVREAVVAREDGSRAVPPPKGAVRADGARPSEAECTALAALALIDDPAAKAWRPDLGATLMTAYRPGLGWGDGRANLVALRAVTQVFAAPLPKQFRLRVSAGGEALVDWKAPEGYADGPFVTARALDASEGVLALTLTPEPPIPGMAFAVRLETHVPWDETVNTPGLALEVDVDGQARVGAPSDVTLRVLAPARAGLVVRHALPAGVVPDEGSLSRLVIDGVIQRFTTEDGAVTLDLPRKAPGEAHTVSYKVVPTLRGRLFAGASAVRLGDACIYPSRMTDRHRGEM